MPTETAGTLFAQALSSCHGSLFIMPVCCMPLAGVLLTGSKVLLSCAPARQPSPAQQHAALAQQLQPAWFPEQKMVFCQGLMGWLSSWSFCRALSCQLSAVQLCCAALHAAQDPAERPGTTCLLTSPLTDCAVVASKLGRVSLQPEPSSQSSSAVLAVTLSCCEQPLHTWSFWRGLRCTHS